MKFDSFTEIVRKAFISVALFTIGTSASAIVMDEGAVCPYDCFNEARHSDVSNQILYGLTDFHFRNGLSVSFGSGTYIGLSGAFLTAKHLFVSANSDQDPFNLLSKTNFVAEIDGLTVPVQRMKSLVSSRMSQGRSSLINDDGWTLQNGIGAEAGVYNGPVQYVILHPTKDLAIVSKSSDYKTYGSFSIGLTAYLADSDAVLATTTFGTGSSAFDAVEGKKLGHSFRAERKGMWASSYIQPGTSVMSDVITESAQFSAVHRARTYDGDWGFAEKGDSGGPLYLQTTNHGESLVGVLSGIGTDGSLVWTSVAPEKNFILSAGRILTNLPSIGSLVEVPFLPSGLQELILGSEASDHIQYFDSFSSSGATRFFRGTTGSHDLLSLKGSSFITSVAFFGTNQLPSVSAGDGSPLEGRWEGNTFIPDSDVRELGFDWSGTGVGEVVLGLNLSGDGVSSLEWAVATSAVSEPESALLAVVGTLFLQSIIVLKNKAVPPAARLFFVSFRYWPKRRPGTQSAPMSSSRPPVLGDVSPFPSPAHRTIGSLPRLGR